MGARAGSGVRVLNDDGGYLEFAHHRGFSITERGGDVGAAPLYPNALRILERQPGCDSTSVAFRNGGSALRRTGHSAYRAEARERAAPAGIGEPERAGPRDHKANAA